jgi:hypothetical protein
VIFELNVVKRTSFRRHIWRADTAAPSWPKRNSFSALRAMLLSALSVSLLLVGVLHPFEDNILGPRVYEALFKGILNVVETNALPFLVPCLLARSPPP